MALINISTMIDVLGGTGVTDAKIVATASSANKPATRQSSATVIFPKRIELDVVSGIPVDDFELTSLPVGMYWSIGVFVNGLTTHRRTVIIPSGDGPFDFDELIDIDPDTSLPDPNSDAATALVEELQAVVDSLSGATGTFTTADSKTITVVNGIITNISSQAGGRIQA